MSNAVTDKRLMLVQQIRQEQQQNHQTIKNREEILSPTDFEPQLEKSFGHSTFLLRLFIAALLFAGYFFLSRDSEGNGELYASKIRSEVNKYSNIDINLFDFMDEITYTLNIK